MNILKLSLTMTLLGALFTGCSTLPQNASQQYSQDIQQQLHTQQPIIAYFHKNAEETESCGCEHNLSSDYSFTATQDGYYRKLLGRSQDGLFLVQDFYQASNKPQTSPFWIKKPEGLNSFDSTYIEGSATGYFENGQVAFSTTLKDGMHIGLNKEYYPSGQLATERNFNDQGELQLSKLWYENGQIAGEIMQNANGEFDLQDAKFWDEQGTLIDNPEQKENIINKIEEKISIAL